MADPSNNIFDDANANHPLDLLINAISGSGEYKIPPEARESQGEFNLEQLLGNDSTGESSRNKRKRSSSPTSERDGKIAKIVKAHIVQTSTERSKPMLIKPASAHGGTTFSTVEVWHPTAGQKSYGKERRMLNPPPILRVSGPLLPLLTQATLQTVLVDTDVARPKGLLSSQSQRIPLLSLPESTPPVQSGLTLKRAEKEEHTRMIREQASRHGFAQTLRFERNKLASRERQALSDGLTFPALWVADLIGKDKEFRLELNLGMPGVEAPDIPVFEPSVPIATQPIAALDETPKHDTATTTEQSNVEPTPDNLFGEHQTLDQASNDIIDQLTEEDRRMLAAESTSGAEQQPESIPDTQQMPLAGPSQPPRWASFASAPISVVSKPSQKTAKARSMNSCFALDDSFALWVRINSQTVRTKYMKMDDGQQPCLTTRTNQWTPFQFEVTENALMPLIPESSSHRDRERQRKPRPNDVLTYGSLGHLVDRQSGVKTEVMRLVKIDKGENVVDTDHGHPVSDLQRVGFVRLHNGQDDYTGGSRWYLSAPGARLGGAELNRSVIQDQAATSSDIDPQILDGVPEEVKPLGKPKSRKKPKTKRFALAEVVVAEDQGGAQFALSWHKAERYEAERVRGFGKELVKKLEICEKVEDWMCWVLGGVDNFKYSFFDGQEHGTLFNNPIDPVARHLSPPVFNAETNTLILTLNEFFPTANQGTSDFKIYLGPIGPIDASLYRSIAPEKAGPDNGHSTHFEAQPYDSTVQDGLHQHIRSDYPGHKPHVIVAINMPPAEKIIRTMQECFAEAQYQPSNTLHAVPEDGVSGTDGWLTAGDASATDQGLHSGNGDTMANTLEQDGSIMNIDPALNAEVGNEGQQHDVDDITAALAAHADDPAFSLSHMGDDFLPSELDPELTAASISRQPEQIEENQQVEESLNTIDAQPQTQAAETIETVPDLQLSKPEQDTKQVEMVPLPIVLVRSVDGVGFTVGRHVVAERVDSRLPGEKPRWGLRVVPA